MLQDNSIYIIDLSYAMPARQKPKVYRWQAERDGIEIDVCWRTTEDYQNRRSEESCTLVVKQHDNQVQELGTTHTTRLWLQQEFNDIIAQSEFVLEAVYDGHFRLLDPERTLHGGLDNLYHILRKTNQH